MAFGYLEGTTAAGAPDEVVDWFATFQQWMTSEVGWTVEAGGGTTDITFRSLGEAGGLTMLYLHVYRDGGLPNRVRIEVKDDLAGTHETAEAGYLDGAGAQFAFWMAGDLDAINICFRGGAVYHSIYAGMVLPFALTVPDETYRMIATSTQIAGSILRDASGVWDVDHPLYDNQLLDDCIIDRYDGSLPLAGTYFDRQANIAGQPKHISAPINDAGPTVMDLLETGRPGATTTWIVLRDRDGRRYAMRTGGVMPLGQQDPGSFAAVTGVAANYGALWTALSAHLVALGWVDLGDPGLWTEGRLYFSAGESGEEEIYIGYARNSAVTDEFFPYVQDDLVPTHRFPTATPRYLDNLDFPINYWICGDRDCCVLVYQRAGGYTLTWCGLLPSFAPGLLAPYAAGPLTVYSAVALMQGAGAGLNISGGLLRGHDGVWNQVVSFTDDGVDADNSNPNNFDGTTYLLWPLLCFESIPPDEEIIGQLRYAFYSSGGGIANMDTITVGARVYTVFHDATGNNFCVRTV